MPTSNHSHTWHSLWKQFGVQCLSQGHFDMRTAGVGNQTADLPEPQTLHHLTPWMKTGHMVMAGEGNWPTKAIQLSYHKFSLVQRRLCSLATETWVGESCSIKWRQQTKWPVRFWLAHPKFVSRVKCYLSGVTMKHKSTKQHTFPWDCMHTHTQLCSITYWSKYYMVNHREDK